MSRNTVATINLPALARNLERVRALAPNANIMAVVKADAYGHGLTRCIPALQSADLLAVATMREAREIRSVDCEIPVLLLEGVTDADELDEVNEFKLEHVVHHAAQLQWIEQSGCRSHQRIWLKLNSGMNRLGFPLEQAREVHQRIQAWPGVEEVVLMTHFACADQPGHAMNQLQRERFDQATAGLEGPHCLSNSGALINDASAHREWVRAGLMLYGVSPLDQQTGHDLGFEPVMRLDSQLIAINAVEAGESIGYGARYTAAHHHRVGVVAIGYGDGYPRNMPDGTPVLVKGQPCPLAGRVSMDMLTVDLSNQPDAALGDPVTLWGPDLPVETIAAAVDTIPYELLCRVSPRVRYEEIEYLRSKPRN